MKRQIYVHRVRYKKTGEIFFMATDNHFALTAIKMLMYYDTVALYFNKIDAQKLRNSVSLAFTANLEPYPINISNEITNLTKII